MKNRIIITFCICLAVSFTACSQRGDTKEPVPSQNQSNIENPHIQSELRKNDSSDFVEDDTFYQSILRTYGGEIATDEAGKPYLRMTQGASLFNKSDWNNPQELDAFDYYLWYMTMMWQEDISIEERQKKYKSPFGEDTGWFFPQDLFEPLVQKYFEVSIEYLRSNPNVYSEEYEGYSIGGGGGIGESPPIILEKVESVGNLRKLYVRLDYEYQEVESRILTVKLEPDGGYKFESYVIAEQKMSKPPEGTVQVAFSVPIINEMGTLLEEKVNFSIYLPSEWIISGTEIFEDDRKVAEVIVRIITFEDTDFLFADAIDVRDFNVGSYPGKYYHMQNELTEGGMTVKLNELIYCLNTGDKTILFIFYPDHGIGIGTQNEQFVSFFNTIQPS